MSFNQADLSLPSGFDNIVRLFPLPNLVLFPGVIQALHIFEPRYRQLMEDTLAADELIAMALIQPGLKSDLVDDPDLCSTVCIGKVVTHARLEDGRFTLLLLGAQRARIVDELHSEKPYRMAKIESVHDVQDGTEADCLNLRRQIQEKFRNLVGRRPKTDEETLSQLLNDKQSLAQMVDLICYSSNAMPFEQQQVLEAEGVCRRAELVLGILKEQESKMDRELNKSTPDFPPDFSLN